MLKFLFTVIRRDVLLAARRRGDWLTAQFFFVMVVSMFPLGIGPEPGMLRTIGPGVVWVAALLASLLSMERLFADDFRDGTLELCCALSQCPADPGKRRTGSSTGFPCADCAGAGNQFNLPVERCCARLALAIGTPSCPCSEASAPR
jgi:heme exporter protein B